MNLNPHTMSRSELLNWVRNCLRIQNRHNLEELIEQWDLHDKLQDTTIFDPGIKDTSKVLLKSSRTRFFKVYYQELNEMFENDKIEALDIGYLILLGKYVDYEDNTLKTDNGNYMSMKDMEKILKVSERTVKRFIKRMTDQKIIYKKLDETDKYKRRNKFFINPHILFKGKYIDKKIKEALDKVRKQVKEIEKENKKMNKGKEIMISILDKLNEMDYTDMSEDEIDILSEELYKLVV